MAGPKPNVPIVTESSSYMNGVNLSFTTTTTITISAGQCKDSTNSNYILFQNPAVINVRVNGVNGLDVGVLAPNTFYAVFAIGDSGANNPNVTFAAGTSGNQPSVGGGGIFVPGAGLISLSAAAPVLPTGFDMFRRIGYILTNATAAPNTLVLKFLQEGHSVDRWMYYDAPIVCLAATAEAAFTPLNINVTNNSVPLTDTNVLFEATLHPNAPADFVALQPGSSTNATGYYARMSGDVAAVNHIGNMISPCSNVGGNPTINYVTDAASTVALDVVGYLDQL